MEEELIIADNRLFVQVQKTAFPSMDTNEDWKLLTVEGDIVEDIIYSNELFVTTVDTTESIEIVPMKTEYDEEHDVTMVWWA